jgi:glycerophosphoryl diester phosphodiesterase
MGTTIHSLRRWTFRILVGLVSGLAVVAMLNASCWSSYRSPTLLLAHRGIAQNLHGSKDSDTCTADIDPPVHGLLENTIASMRAAFDAGADIVEFDIHPTTDGQFAVFHDWTVDCKTEGHGRTRDHSMAELEALDIGYGYTADGGKTFPFRGKGVGLMPTLDDVLSAFPARRLLINVKSNDPAEGELLAARLARLPPERLEQLMSYGGDRPMSVLRARLPSLRVMSRESETACVKRYIAIGWTSAIPDACRRSMIIVPLDIAPWIWGWPNLFLERMTKVGTQVFVAGPGTTNTTGIDSEQMVQRLPEDFSGGIWTNRIDLLGPLFGRRPNPAH